MFRNRHDAALSLAQHLEKYRGEDGIVLAIPRGGVPIGYVIAQKLGFPMEVALSKKIGHPNNSEYAIGSVSLDSVSVDEQAAAADRHDRPPYTAVAIWIICAETDEQAQRIAASGRMAFTLLRRGQPVAIPSPEKAERFLASDQGRPAPGPRPRRRTIVGDPATVRAQVQEVAESYGADEVIAVNVTYSHEDRRRSYELLAEAFALQAVGS